VIRSTAPAESSTSLMMRVRAFLARRPLAAVTSTCVFLLCLLCGVLLVSASRESSGASHLVPGQAQQSHAERSIAEGGQGGESEMEQVRRRMQEEKVIIREDDIESTDAPLSSSSSSTTSSRPIQIDDIEACTPQPYNFGSYSYCGANFYDSSSYPVPTPVAGSTWNLVQLQLITRHGDRTPVNILPVYDVAYPFCDTTQSLGFYGTLASSAGEMGHTTKASQKQQHNRHHPRRRVASQQEGRRLERIPYLAEPSVSNPYASQLWEGSCMTGQLTSQGVQQLEEIGRAFRTVYVDQLGFLPSTYSRANTSFYLRTTDVWRTRQSAESLLTGLWPASDLESDVIPLHSFPAEIETMYANPTACDAVASVELQQYASDAWKAHLDAPEIWKELDSVLGVGDLPDWHLAYDHYVSGGSDAISRFVAL
jgi:hypothetical protein